MVKFSFIIPVYNVAPYLRACLDSVCAQTFKDWEAICVDDGSTDGSSDVLDEYALRNAKFRIFHQENSGVGVARNVGLNSATGEWICFLDADDILDSRFLVACCELIELYGRPALLQLGYSEFQDEKCLSFAKDLAVCYKCIDASIKLPYGIVLTHFFTMVYRRDLIGSVRFPLYSVGEDRIFLANCLSYVDRIVITSEKLYGYRIRSGSAMNSAMTKGKILDRMRAVVDWMFVLVKSGKVVPPVVCHIIAIELMEVCVRDVLRLRECDREQMWDAWYEELDRISIYKSYFSIWTRFVLLMCRGLKFRLIPIVLCCGPDLLKRLGFHR